MRQGNVGARCRRCAPPTRSATSTRATTTSPRPTYDSKWGIDFGDVGQEQVLGKLRKLLGRDLDRGFERSLEIGAGTGYFSLNLLQAGVLRRGDLHRHLPRDGDDARRQRPPARARQRQRDRAPTPSRSRSPIRASTSCSATPCSTTCPTWSGRSPSSTACCAPGGTDRVRRRAVAASATGSRALPKRAAGAARARSGGAAVRARPAPPASRRLDEHARDHELERSSTSTRSRQPTSRGSRGAPASQTSRCAARSWSRTGSAGSTAALEASANPDDVPMFWRQYAFHGYLLLQRLDERVLEPRCPPAIFYNLLITRAASRDRTRPARRR